MNKDEYFLKLAFVTAERSKDPSSKIGSVLVRDGTVISTGYNGFPIGTNDAKELYDERETKYKRVCHSEANSIFLAARNGVSTLGCTLYTLAIPCNECAKAIIQAGVKKVIVHDQYSMIFAESSERWEQSAKTSDTLFREAGVKCELYFNPTDKLGVKSVIRGKTYEF